MLLLDVGDIVGLELVGRESQQDGAVVGERLDGRVRAGEVSSQGGEPNGVQDVVERDRSTIQVGSDGPVSSAGPLRSVGRLAVVVQQRVEVVASGHGVGLARRRVRAFVRCAARRRSSSLDSLSR